MTVVYMTRPKMPRATWEALRNHIIKERKRKQEEEEKSEEYERYHGIQYFLNSGN